MGASPPRAAPTLRLRAGYELVFALDGDVYVLRPGAEREFVVRGPGEQDRRLLRELEASGVCLELEGEAGRRLAPLVDLGIVVAAPKMALEGEDAERFARQLGYLEDLGDPADLQRRLRASRVAVLGCGGLGTWALAALASVGVGSFVLVDDDRIELSNLNRQVLYRRQDVGLPKVARAGAWITAFDPAVQVEAHEVRVTGPDVLAPLVEGCDVVVATADWPPYELMRWVNDVCVATRTPFVAAGQQPPLLKVGPTYVPGRTACLACHEAGASEAFPLYAELAADADRRPADDVTLGPASGFVGSVIGLELLHLLTGAGPISTAGRALLVDLRTLSTRWEPIGRRLDCPVCGQLFK